MNELAPLTFDIQPAMLATETAEAIDELNSLQDATVDSDDDAAEAAALLREIVRKKDVFSALRDGLLKPVKRRVTDFAALFKPALDARTASEVKLKRLLADFTLGKQAEQRKQLAAAAEAAQARQPEAMSTALIAAHEAAPSKLEGVGVRSKWVVKRIAEDLLPDEYWTPDVKKIEAVAREASPDDRPVIPGVVFELDATVSARR